MATNFVSRVITIALVFIASSVGKPLGVEVVVCKKKHAIVLLVEEDNCLKHWNVSRGWHVINQGRGSAQAVEETPPKHLPQTPLKKKPVRRKTVHGYIQRLSSPAAYSSFTYLTLFTSYNNFKNDDIIVHFTVVCLVTKPLNRSEAEVDFVVRQTLLLFKCKLLCYHTN